MIEDDTDVSLYDKAGEPSLRLGVSEDDTYVSLFDKADMLRASLVVTSLKNSEFAPESSLTLFDKDRKVIHRIP